MPRMIVFVHLLNDRSGSPKVLASAIEALSRQGHAAHLFVGSDGQGCLDDVDVARTRYWYRRSRFRPLTFLNFIASQIHLFFALLRTREIARDAIIYVNTLLPFGAALYGRLTGRTVVYHLHELSLTPRVLLAGLSLMAKSCAGRVVYVSEYHRKMLELGEVSARTVYNAPDLGLLDRSADAAYQHRRDGVFTVLMLASLRDYKGVPEFVRLAARLQSRHDVVFELVANEDPQEVARFRKHQALPRNLRIHARTSDPSTWYARASLVLNLSRPDQWIETFGLTIVEAFAFGVPVIAPPVGGPVELLDDGVQGYLLDCRDEEAVFRCVQSLADDAATCLRLSAAARQKARHFSPAVFAQKISEAVCFEAKP